MNMADRKSYLLVNCSPGFRDKSIFEVEIASRKLSQLSGANGEPQRAPKEGLVTVATVPQITVLNFSPPEIPVPGLSREEYDEIAIEAVQKHLTTAAA